MLVIATSYFIWKAYNMSGVCSVTVKQTNKQAQAREVNALTCENSDGF